MPRGGVDVPPSARRKLKPQGNLTLKRQRYSPPCSSSQRSLSFLARKHTGSARQAPTSTVPASAVPIAAVPATAIPAAGIIYLAVPTTAVPSAACAHLCGVPERDTSSGRSLKGLHQVGLAVRLAKPGALVAPLKCADANLSSRHACVRACVLECREWRGWDVDARMCGRLGVALNGEQYPPFTVHRSPGDR
eukprot:365547-Chlamydomonas_euryale.AAC.6